MLETAFAQLRLAASLAFGIRFSLKSLDQLIDAMIATHREFGGFGHEIGELLGGPQLDEETRHELQLRRFRKQAVRAAHQTPYYRTLFTQLGLNPKQLTWDDIARLPCTPKSALRDDPDAFVCRQAGHYLRTMTTGTTGWPTSVYFSDYELKVIVALAAFDTLIRGNFSPEDVVQMHYLARATHINIGIGGTLARLGALLHQVGQVAPPQALKLLVDKRALAHKKDQVSIALSYPSYLAALVETGLQQGYGPDDFGLEHIVWGGELVTQGMKDRAQQLFGPVSFFENYALTEMLPFGGTRCSQNHLHFEASHGLMEVLNPDTDQPAQPGEIGKLVMTPFPPYRETTLLLRYDTQDIVRTLIEPPTCELRHLPATSHVLGKLNHAVRPEQGWVLPRNIQEALDGVEAVPLPSRYGFWAISDGVAVEVLVRDDTPAVRQSLETRLLEQGVPLSKLYLVTHPEQLHHALPLRCDLHENTIRG